MNVVQKKREGGPLPSAARAETTIQTNEDEAVFETPTDDAGNLYFDTGCFADELPDSSQHMPEYKYTVTGACVRMCVLQRYHPTCDVH